MAVNVCVLRSGSKGNCTVVWSKDGALLLDCGNFPMRPFCNELNGIGLEPEDIKGIIISHGHGDHINHYTLKISSAFDIPLHIHRKTHNVIQGRLGTSHPKQLIKHHDKEPFLVNGVTVTPFETFHKGGYVGKPFGFFLERKGLEKSKIGYLTDTSKVSQEMIECLANSDILMIESNHDLDIVKEKRPVDKNWLGHLNNEAAANAVVSIKKASRRRNALKQVFVMHISGRHNEPKLIEKVFSKKFKEANIHGVKVILTKQKVPSAIKTI